jgi:hypothetical protein
MQTIFDPQAARAFAAMLDQQSKDLDGHTMRMTKSAVDLYGTWQDQKYDTFFKQFEEATLKLKEFFIQAAKYSRYLREMSAKAERYHDQRW